MSTAKRPRQGQSDTEPFPSANPSKKPRLSGRQGLGSLLDDNGKNAGPLRAQLSHNGVKETARNRHDDSHSVIASNLQAQDDVDMDAASSALAPSDSVMSSGDDQDDENNDSDVVVDIEEDTPPTKGPQSGSVMAPSHPQSTAVLTNGTHHDGQDTKTSLQASAPSESPAFGDMLLAKYPNPIDVEASFAYQNAHSTALVPADGSRNLQPPPATSLATVLTQALKTNDRELLESCLQMNDVASIRSTIQRLQSPHIASLMLRLAERLHKRPGRAGALMHWIQWSLVAHGGYLASQPELVRKLASLFMVVRERANSLQPLMMLKGKLDLLSAQVELRRSSHRQRPRQTAEDEEDELERDDIIYVEGQDESSTDDGDAAFDNGVRNTLAKPSRRAKNALRLGSPNGIDGETSESGEDLALGPLIDDEAEESSGSENDISSESEEEDEEDHDDNLDHDDEDDNVASDDAEDIDMEDDQIGGNLPVSGSGKPHKGRSALAERRSKNTSISNRRR